MYHHFTVPLPSAYGDFALVRCSRAIESFALCSSGATGNYGLVRQCRAEGLDSQSRAVSRVQTVRIATRDSCCKREKKSGPVLVVAFMKAMLATIGIPTALKSLRSGCDSSTGVPI
jgi:hypothetical protein